MTQQTNISFSEKVWFNEEFIKLKLERKLSKTINDLLISHLNMEKQAVPDDQAGIEDALRDLAARKALLLQKKEYLDKKKAKEEARYVRL